ELQADDRAEHHQRADDRVGDDDAAGGHADEGADDRRHHRQREQQVRIAKDFLAFGGDGIVRRRRVEVTAVIRAAILLIGPNRLEFHSYVYPPARKTTKPVQSFNDLAVLWTPLSRFRS